MVKLLLASSLAELFTMSVKILKFRGADLAPVFVKARLVYLCRVSVDVLFPYKKCQ